MLYRKPFVAAARSFEIFLSFNATWKGWSMVSFFFFFPISPLIRTLPSSWLIMEVLPSWYLMYSLVYVFVAFAIVRFLSLWFHEILSFNHKGDQLWYLHFPGKDLKQLQMDKMSEFDLAAQTILSMDCIYG